MPETKLVSLEVADYYQPLFNLMSNEHGLILTISEMDEIIRTCGKVKVDFDNNMSAIKDAEGQLLHPGDRVYCLGFNGERVYGTLYENEDYKEISEWYVEYDDGQDCAILDFKQLWKA